MHSPRNVARSAALLLISLLLLACGNDDDGPGVAPVAQPSPAAPMATGTSVGGHPVKGPLGNAVVEIFAFDGTAADGRGASVARGTTNASSAFVGVAIPEDSTGPLIVVVTADADTTDLTTGAPPVIGEMVTAIDAAELLADPGASVYPSPLTTLAVDMALARADATTDGFRGDADGVVTAAEFLAAIEIAAARIADQFGFGLLDDVDLLRQAPVLLEGATDDAEAQVRVARLRTAIEGVTALAAKLAVDRDQAVGEGSNATTVGAAFSALRADAADGEVDGSAGGRVIDLFAGFATLASSLQVDPGALTIPGTDRTVAEARRLLAEERAATGNAAAASDAAENADTGTAPARSGPDLDRDGVPDVRDPDDDGDGVEDGDDAFPRDPAESRDTDGDGVGDGVDPDIDGDGEANAVDADDDGDGTPDASDAFPGDPTEDSDTDGDGIGDGADEDADGNGIDDALDAVLTALPDIALRRTMLTGAPEIRVTGDVDADAGGRLTLPDGARLEILPGTLPMDTEISVTLPAAQGPESERRDYRFEPDGLLFAEPARFTIVRPLAEDEPPVYGQSFIASSRNPQTRSGSVLTRMAPAETLAVALEGDVLSSTYALPHFSFWKSSFDVDQLAYLVKDIPPDYLLPGDLLFVLTGPRDSNFDRLETSWSPGHVGLFTSDNDACTLPRSAEIIESTTGNTDGVQRSTFGAFSGRRADHVYMGARRPASGSDLSDAERAGITRFARDNLGQPYALTRIGDVTCLDRSFSCAGLAESAYDEVGRGNLGASEELTFSTPRDIFEATAPIRRIEARQGEIIEIPLRTVVVHPSTTSGTVNSGFYCDEATARNCSEAGVANIGLVENLGGLPPGASFSVEEGRSLIRWDTSIAAEAGVTSFDFRFRMTANVNLSLPSVELFEAAVSLVEGRPTDRPSFERTIVEDEHLEIVLVPCADGDGDGIDDAIDTDDDGDGEPDASDAFPDDPAEQRDTDGDGTGDEADTDDDGDGVPDATDAFPLDPQETTDSDGDGTGDRADPDDDDDGVPDAEDQFPGAVDGLAASGLTLSARLPPREIAVGDTAEIAFDFTLVGALDLEVLRIGQSFSGPITVTQADGSVLEEPGDAPFDVPVAGSPLAGPGIEAEPRTLTARIGLRCDAANSFALSFRFALDGSLPGEPERVPGNVLFDPVEAFDLDDGAVFSGRCVEGDRDGDGVPDARDAFPDDENETVDTDGDGEGDNADGDDDGDGEPDTSDAFPLDPAETLDTDGDGTGDAADPNDDGDAFPDTDDAFPKQDAEPLLDARFRFEQALSNTDVRIGEAEQIFFSLGALAEAPPVDLTRILLPGDGGIALSDNIVVTLFDLTDPENETAVVVESESLPLLGDPVTLMRPTFLSAGGGLTTDASITCLAEGPFSVRLTPVLLEYGNEDFDPFVDRVLNLRSLPQETLTGTCLPPRDTDGDGTPDTLDVFPERSNGALAEGNQIFSTFLESALIETGTSGALYLAATRTDATPSLPVAEQDLTEIEFGTGGFLITPGIRVRAQFGIQGEASSVQERTFSFQGDLPTSVPGTTPDGVTRYLTLDVVCDEEGAFTVSFANIRARFGTLLVETDPTRSLADLNASGMCVGEIPKDSDGDGIQDADDAAPDDPDVVVDGAVGRFSLTPSSIPAGDRGRLLASFPSVVAIDPVTETPRNAFDVVVQGPIELVPDVNALVQFTSSRLPLLGAETPYHVQCTAPGDFDIRVTSVTLDSASGPRTAAVSAVLAGECLGVSPPLPRLDCRSNPTGTCPANEVGFFNTFQATPLVAPDGYPYTRPFFRPATTGATVVYIDPALLEGSTDVTCEVGFQSNANCAFLETGPSTFATSSTSATATDTRVFRVRYPSPDPDRLTPPSLPARDVRVTTSLQDVVLSQPGNSAPSIAGAVAGPAFGENDTAVFSVDGRTILTLPTGGTGSDASGEQILVDESAGLSTTVRVPAGYALMRSFVFTRGPETGTPLLEAYIVEQPVSAGMPGDEGTTLLPIVPTALLDEIAGAGGPNPDAGIVVTAIQRGTSDEIFPAADAADPTPLGVQVQAGLSLVLPPSALEPPPDACAARPTGLRCAAGPAESLLVTDSAGTVGRYDPVDGRFVSNFLGQPNFVISSGWLAEQGPDNCILLSDSDGLHLYDTDGSVFGGDGSGGLGGGSNPLVSALDAGARGFTFHTPDEGATWHLYLVKNDAEIVRYDYARTGPTVLSNRTVLVDQARLPGDTTDIEFNDIAILGDLIHVGDESPTATTEPVDRLFRYDLTGAFVDVFLDDLATPYQIGETYDGQLYVVDFGLETVRILEETGALARRYVLDPDGVGGQTTSDERPRGFHPLRNGDYQIAGRTGVSTIARRPASGTGTARDPGTTERFIGTACLAP